MPLGKDGVGLIRRPEPCARTPARSSHSTTKSQRRARLFHKIAFTGALLCGLWGGYGFRSRLDGGRRRLGRVPGRQARLVQGIADTAGVHGVQAGNRHFGAGGKDGIKEVQDLPPVNGRLSGGEDQHIARLDDAALAVFFRAGQPHALVRREQRPGCFGHVDRRVFHVAGARTGERHLFFHDSGFARHVGKGFGRFNGVRRVGNPHMAVGHERVFLAVHAVELGDVLNDDVDLAAVASDVGQGFFHNRELAQAGKLVQEQQEAMLVTRLAGTVREFHFGADAAHDHIHHEPEQGPHPVNVSRRNHQV